MSIRLLADETSIAWQRTSTLGPFNIVNIDLCGHVGNESPLVDTSLYNAVARIVSAQAHPGHVWSLFLTTRIGKDDFDAGAWSKVVKTLKSNIADCIGFSEELYAAFESVPDVLEDRQGWTEREFFEVSSTAIAKWLLKLVDAHGGALELSSVFSYRINPGSGFDDMVSLAFRVKQPYRIVADPTGLSTLVSPPMNECERAKPMPGIIATAINVDTKLQGDPDLAVLCLDEAAALMQQARYDVEEYRRWVEDAP
jgi:hypothetical protein